MGLDMYAYATDNQPATPVDASTEHRTQLHYWRKHPNLHGWMENLYREKGGRGEFNCVRVDLTLEDLHDLELDVRAGILPETSGCFFGVSDGTEVEDDLRFITKARRAINKGKYVYYLSWW